MNIILILPTKKYLGSHMTLSRNVQLSPTLKQGLTNNGPRTKPNAILLNLLNHHPHPHSEVTYDCFHTTAKPVIETV